ncbi:glycosyltransferase [Martelella alba]|uniref:glycosyltransferase n=1 Tax=Martelella alba TaxID=2590451 RepID=UPI0014852ECD|nr:glycosyltransferase [Martelella alba]
MPLSAKARPIASAFSGGPNTPGRHDGDVRGHVRPAQGSVVDGKPRRPKPPTGAPPQVARSVKVVNRRHEAGAFDLSPGGGGLLRMGASLSQFIARLGGRLDKLTTFPTVAATQFPDVSAEEKERIIDIGGAEFHSQARAIAIRHDQNVAMAEFLRQYLNAPAANVSSARLVDAAFRYLNAWDNNPAEPARVLLDAMAYYAGDDKTPIPPALAWDVLRRWLHVNVLGETFLDYFIGETAGLLDRRTTTWAQMGEWLHNTTTDYVRRHFAAHAPADNALLAERLWRVLILQELPILNGWRENGGLTDEPDDFTLGDAQAGWLFARYNGLDEQTLSRTEAAELGNLIYLQIEAGEAPPQWMLFFQIPAVMWFSRQSDGWHIPAPAARRDIVALLRRYFLAKGRYLEESNPFNALSAAIKGYRTRPQLAEAIINATCPSLSVGQYLLDITAFCRDMAPHIMPEYPSSFGLGGAEGDNNGDGGFFLFNLRWQKQEYPLPNIDALFSAQNDAIGKKYAIVDRLLLVSALNGIFSLDDNYWNTRQVDSILVEPVRNQPRFGLKYCSKLFHKGSISRYFFDERQHTLISAPNVELFTIHWQDTVSLYALTMDDIGYAVKAIAELDSARLRHSAQQPYSHCLRTGKVLKERRQTAPDFVDTLAAAHTQVFVEGLRAQGYHKHVLHAARDFLLSLLPFYSCVDGVKTDPLGETLFDCGMDIVSLLPVLGPLSKMTGQTGTVFIRGLQKTGREALMMMAARKSLGNIAATSVKNIAAHSLMPASRSLTLEQTMALAGEIVRFIDPGFELLGFAGKNAIQRIISLNDAMGTGLPGIGAMLRRLRHVSSSFPSTPRSWAFLARYAGGDKRVGIVRIPGQRHRGREIFAIKNLDSGMVFGPKLYLSKTGKLKMIPLAFRQRLKNLRQQGLGGRGAPRAAARWNAGAGGQGERAGTSRVAESVITHRAAQGDTGYGLSVDKNVITGDLDGQTVSLIFDLSHNVYYPRIGKTMIHFMIDEPYHNPLILNSAGLLEKWRQPNLIPASLAAQAEGIRLLGIELDWARSPLSIDEEKKRDIPRKITSIWLGDKDIPEEILRSLQNNAVRAREGNKPYRFKLYLSSQSQKAFERNLEALITKAKDVVVRNLEHSDYFIAFRKTKYYEQYLSAIRGNKGVATNFASACDILRIDLVNRRGGLYLDADDMLISPPAATELKTTSEGLVLSTPVFHSVMRVSGKYPNSNWGTHAGNPTLWKMMEESYQRYSQNKDIYLYRPPESDMEAFSRYAARVSYVGGPDLLNFIIDRFLPCEKQTREALKLYHLPIVMERETYHRLLSFIDRGVCALKEVVDIGNAHSWRFTR